MVSIIVLCVFGVLYMVIRGHIWGEFGSIWSVFGLLVCI
jgi:hypothetical protein